uniref:Uncharacterized protein n=1 Tax=Eubacterium cellulosolvens (strain ATCC 43171 / JCM 9499 / 6) TaxID=633697 RepID=I5AT19_EUBC6
MDLSVNANKRVLLSGYDKTMTEIALKRITRKNKQIELEKAYREASDEGNCDSLVLSNDGKDWVENGRNNVTAVNNTIELRDPIFDYNQEHGTSIKVDLDGGIEREIRQDAAEDLIGDIESIFQNIMSRDDHLFWFYLSGDPYGLELRFSDEEIRNRLSDAKIQPGFFNVSFGLRASTQFYSQAKGAVAVHSKEKYDERYNTLLSEDFLKDYKVGQKFLIGGKEYTLSEDRKLDVPYGADIFDFKRLSD